jgi:regulator of protease activity HflC (stomatin/prohibitin superfamily)
MDISLIPFVFLAFIVLIVLGATIKILPEWDRGVIQRFGRFTDVRGPGLIILIPFVEQMRVVDTRVVTMDVPPQDVITKDNISVKVNAVLYFRVVKPEHAINQVEDYYFATSQYAQTSLRSVLGQYDLDDLLQAREKINATLQTVIDRATEPWGVKVTGVEMKNVDIPKEMQRAMAAQAEAERDRRAKVISADGELERSEKLSEAARRLSTNPGAMQLAYLQALNEIANEGTKTIVFPIPMDMMEVWSGLSGKKQA